MINEDRIGNKSQKNILQKPSRCTFNCSAAESIAEIEKFCKNIWKNEIHNANAKMIIRPENKPQRSYRTLKDIQCPIKNLKSI